MSDVVIPIYRGRVPSVPEQSFVAGLIDEPTIAAYNEYLAQTAVEAVDQILPEIQQAASDAEAAAARAEAAVAPNVKQFRTQAAASAATIAPDVTLLYLTDPAATFAFSPTQPDTIFRFQSADGKWWGRVFTTMTVAAGDYGAPSLVGPYGAGFTFGVGGTIGMTDVNGQILEFSKGGVSSIAGTDPEGAAYRWNLRYDFPMTMRLQGVAAETAPGSGVYIGSGSGLYISSFKGPVVLRTHRGGGLRGADQPLAANQTVLAINATGTVNTDGLQAPIGIMSWITDGPLVEGSAPGRLVISVTPAGSALAAPQLLINGQGIGNAMGAFYNYATGALRFPQFLAGTMPTAAELLGNTARNNSILGGFLATSKDGTTRVLENVPYFVRIAWPGKPTSGSDTRSAAIPLPLQMYRQGGVSLGLSHCYAEVAATTGATFRIDHISAATGAVTTNVGTATWGAGAKVGTVTWSPSTMFPLALADELRGVPTGAIDATLSAPVIVIAAAVVMPQ